MRVGRTRLIRRYPVWNTRKERNMLPLEEEWKSGGGNDNIPFLGGRHDAALTGSAA